MPTRQVTENVRSAQLVVSSLRTNRDAVARALAARFGRSAGEAAFAAAVTLMLDGIADTLDAAITLLVAKDDALQRELGDDKTLIEERDEALAGLYELLSGLRETVSAAIGAEGAARIGFTAGKTPREAFELARLGAQVAGNLAGMSPVATKVRGYTFEPAAYLSDVTTGTGRLSAAATALVEDLRANQAVRAERDTAAVEYAGSFSDGAGVASALMRAAGMDATADRLRPNGRRPGNVAEAEDPEPIPAPAA